MAEFQARVQALFLPGGVLSSQLPGFRPRPGQLEMALAVAQAMESGEPLVVEAGTGVGKTYAYLVPALLSGQRVVVSTASKTLQDQLFARDLPRLMAALGVSAHVALLKGRSSYLCQHRAALARAQLSASDTAGAATLARVEQWAQVTRTGDLAELPGLDEGSPVITWITSTRDNCLGTQCPSARECHVNRARREAMAAEIVVINHHLFFADLAMRESGMAELLPTVHSVIFDEAHQLNETGIQFMGLQLSTAQIQELAQDLLACGLQLARGLQDWQTLASRLDRCARDLRLLAGRRTSATKLRWGTNAPEGVTQVLWAQQLGELSLQCREVIGALDTVTELAPDFVRLHERASDLQQRTEHFLAPAGADTVRWLEAGFHLRLMESPLDIAQTVRSRLLQEQRADAPPRAWVFASATLGDESGLAWFTEPCGLGHAKTLRIGSPFDYARQAALYVPPDLPLPASPSHSHQVARQVAQITGQLKGRTLVLTTTIRALREIAHELLQMLSNTAAPEVLMQGQSPKRQLLERFMRAHAGGGRGCVLVASASFWEGVDLPGDALQAVVIDKLPFPPPNDPIVEARSRRLEQLGRSAFGDFHLPEAAVALRQGAGRLIRSEQDRGVLLVCDVRLRTKAYGRRLISALPPMRQLKDEQALLAYLAEITTSSTTDQTCPENLV